MQDRENLQKALSNILKPKSGSVNMLFKDNKGQTITISYNEKLIPSKASVHLL